MIKQADATLPHDPATEEAAIAVWLESELGCSEVTIRRMHRWRPIYEAEAVRDGKRERHRRNKTTKSELGAVSFIVSDSMTRGRFLTA